MNTAHGRVLLRRNGVGVPGLLISLYGAPGGATSSGAGSDLWEPLGSVLSGSGGSFSFDYEPSALGGAGRQFFALLVVVSSPDAEFDPANPAQGSIASLLRRRAGPSEAFAIRVTDKQVTDAGVPRPQAGRSIDEQVAEAKETAARNRKLNLEFGKIFAEDLRTRQELREMARSKMAPFLSLLSGRRDGRPRGKYVPPGASVAEATRAALRSTMEQRINKASLTGRIGVSEKQMALLSDANGNLLQNLDPEIMQEILKPQSSAALLGLGRLSLERMCGPDEVDDCIAQLKVDAPDEDDPDPLTDDEEPPVPDDNEPPTALVQADIPFLLGTLSGNVTSPEATDALGIPVRPGVKDVEQSVHAFSLHSGPADVPAFHDFHQVRIAFEPVWTELFDDDVIGKGEELYEALVEVGEDPNKYLISDDDWKPIAPKPKNAKSGGGKDAEMPDVVARMFEITPEQWDVLSVDYRTSLKNLATSMNDIRLMPTETEISLPFINKTIEVPVSDNEIRYRESMVRFLREQGNRMLLYADRLVMTPDRFDRFHEILADLSKALKEPHRFSVFAANRWERSVNFGVVASYRQIWSPVTYQVGKLVKTVPLAPKETRRFTKKWIVRQNRAEKEVENNLQARKTESTETARAETSILEKATRKTNFKLSAEGGVDIEIASASASSAFSHEAASESQEAKKEFREAVFKAAEEYKHERNLEVSVTDFTETQGEETGEISNPNDEIPVTYLFYELQRRYKISEHLRRVTPVILVAQEVPKPSQIDDAWLLAHDWILRRVILDDSFVPAMNYLASKVVGDEFAIEEQYKNVQQQRRVVDELKEELVSMRQQANRRYAALERSLEKRAEAIQAEEEGDDIIPMPVGFIFSGSEAQSAEAMQVREEAARDAFERVARLEKDVQGRLEREVTALNAQTEAYTKALSDHLNRRAQIARLRVHIKANILYYMQAIWSHEAPDQRYFRLHEVEVPILKGQKTFSLEEDPDGVPSPPDWKPPLKVVMKCELDSELEFETLEETADLDNLIGFKGNYMMFPLKKTNDLTDFMMLPYIDPASGLRDPDPAATWTLSEFSEYVCCLKEHVTKTRFEQLRPRLLEFYLKLIQMPRADEEELVVPTDSLFIEALPGAHPILEDFKLLHRAVDVKKVQAEVRALEIENVRAAARLLAGEREDPSIERKIVIEGGGDINVPVEG